MSRRVTPEEYAERVKAVWGDRITLLTPYVTRNTKVLVYYNECGHEDYKDPIKLVAGQGCSACRYITASKNHQKTTKQFLDELNEKRPDLELLSDYNGVKEKITVRNLSCGHTYSALSGNILRGSGCPVCHGMKDTEQFQQLLESKYPGEYTVLGEYVNNRTKLAVRHKCGFVWEAGPKRLLSRFTCPNCNKSYGEWLVSKFLNDNHIEYEQEKWFADCRDKLPLPFDFIVTHNSSISAIEVDGQHHFGGRSIYAQNIETIKRHDAIKNEYCKANSIPLLRIPFNWINEEGRIYSELSSFLSI